MNKDEIVKQYVEAIYKKQADMPKAFKQMNLAEKKCMDNGFVFAVQSSIDILNNLLDEKKANGFKEFVKSLAPKPLTQADIDKEKIKVEMEKQKLTLAKLRSEKNALIKGSGGGTSTIGGFVRNGANYNPLGKNPFDKGDKQ